LNVLIVDNFDSFTFNLYHYVSEFVENCTVVRSDKLSEIEFINYNKIILSPGPSLPKNHTNLFKFLKNYSESKSILGICLGMQAIAEFFGGKLKNLEKVKHGVSSKNRVIMKDNLYKNIPKEFEIGHYHSWVVDRDLLPSCFHITSINDDDLIMSISHNSLDIKGVQFHPESVLTNYGKKLIKNWLFS
tara:strand:+ start:3548 stop:4111 length:564 start_codon:yes stop_codon:yes gene_type:complete